MERMQIRLTLDRSEITELVLTEFRITWKHPGLDSRWFHRRYVPENWSPTDLFDGIGDNYAPTKH